MAVSVAPCPAGAAGRARAPQRAPSGSGWLRAALLASTALVAAMPAARAQDATWLLNPGSGDFNSPANWNPAAVPLGTAFFGASNTTSLTFSEPFTGIGGWTFIAGAQNYQFFIPQQLVFSGAGIDITAGSATIINTFGLRFQNASTAGSATVTNNSLLQFIATSTAGSAVITNNGTLQFQNASTAGSATITNNASLQFFTTSTAGSAAITNNPVGLVDFSGSANPLLSAGSIAGAGSFILGANQLTVGGNNQSTEVSGVISGGGGSLVKTGAGTLILSGANTYTGPTTITGGILQIGTAALTGTILGQVIVTGGPNGLDIVNADMTGVSGIINAGTVRFFNSTSAPAVILNSSFLHFFDTSTAGSASITNSETLRFHDTSTAGSAIITNNRSCNFSTPARPAAPTSPTTIFCNSTTPARPATPPSPTTLAARSLSSAPARPTAPPSPTMRHLEFLNTSTAGSATITNNSILSFWTPARPAAPPSPTIST